MKKVLSVIIAVVMLLSASTTAFAVESAETSTEAAVEVKYNSEYMFSYTEQTDANYRIVRTYTNESIDASANARTVSTMAVDPTQSETSTERVKAILLSLGMGQDFIDMLSEEDLEDYANCEMMMGITSYTKEGADGNVENVPEEEALANARLGSFPEQDLYDPSPGSGGAHSTVEIDSYMHIYYLVTYMGNGLYKFSVDATWLKSPVYRLTDSIGACAQNFAIQNATRSGWYMCTVYGYAMFEYYTNTYTTYFEDFYTVQNGNWDGSAAMFNLHDDYTSTEAAYSQIAYDHKAHYQFEAYVSYPSRDTYFNTTATYSHTLIWLEADPSISISAEESSVSIGLGLGDRSEDRVAEFASAIHYVPD